MPTFEKMEELAKDDSSESRRELLRALTDLFLENRDQNTDESGEAFGDIVGRVLDDVVEEARAEFSARVATTGELPKDIILKLAWDTFEVASPVLEHSAALTDEDLIEVAAKQSDDHLLAISRRSELNESVTDVLIERGGNGVIHSVASNPGAQFSTQGYGTLASKAQDDEKLQATLVDRPDVTPVVASQLEPFLNAQLKRRLAKSLKESNGDVAGLVAKAKDRVEQALVGKKRDQVDVVKLISKVKAGEITISDATGKFAKKKRPVPLSSLIAGLAELPDKMISNAMLKVNGMPIAITCRALKIDPETFAEIAKMRCDILKLPSSSGERLSAQYIELDEVDAERTLRFLKVRQSLSGGASESAA